MTYERSRQARVAESRVHDWAAPFEIALVVRDGDGAVVFEGATSTASMRRSFAELVEYVRRDNPLGPGTLLLTEPASSRPTRSRSPPARPWRSRCRGSGGWSIR